MDGSHIRRQVAIGPYVADFCCLSEHVVVEVDGGQHSTDRNAAHDAGRTAELNRRGFRVLRFTNADVMRDIDSVVETIFGKGT